MARSTDGAAVPPAPRGSLKALFLLFVLFMLITSTPAAALLGGLEGTYEGRAATPYGATIQGLLLVLLYVMLGSLMGVSLT